jgi:hypothetical protein
MRIGECCTEDRVLRGRVGSGKEVLGSLFFHGRRFTRAGVNRRQRRG